MPRGGKRAGAGRKKGALTKRTQEVAAQALADGLTPLDYMLQVMRDPAEDRAVRLDAAKAAAPYVHPRLSSVDHKGNDDGRPIIYEIVTGVPRSEEFGHWDRDDEDLPNGHGALPDN